MKNLNIGFLSLKSVLLKDCYVVAINFIIFIYKKLWAEQNERFFHQFVGLSHD